MWYLQRGVLDEELVCALRALIGPERSKESNYAFSLDPQIKMSLKTQAGIGLLGRIVARLKAYGLLKIYAEPCIHHAFPLIKPPGGQQTKLHQDIAFWTQSIRERVTMLTYYFALGDMTSRNGGLYISAAGRTESLETLNTPQPTLPHIHGAYDPGDAGTESFFVADPDAIARAEGECRCVDLAAGDLIIFDAFEPHYTSVNATDGPRAAMKIVMGEKAQLNRYQFEVAV